MIVDQGKQRCQISEIGSDSEKLLVLLCTYNERAAITSIVPQILAAVPLAELVVVDDQSPDGTGEWVRELGQADQRVHLLSRPSKLGLGTAILAGLNWGVARDFEWIVNLDADLSHDPRDIPRLLAAARGPPSFDIAVASRYIEGGRIQGWPWYRREMSRRLNQTARSLLRLPVLDCSGSFRCYRVAALKKAPLDRLRATGYALLEELLLLLHQQGCSMTEIPICFTDRQLGRSKLTLGEALRTITTIYRLKQKP
jgi:dolichol-phosphate mannosyltransferase